MMFSLSYYFGLAPEDVPAEVKPVQIKPVGRYAVQIYWTDGHDSGIYTFENLRGLASLSLSDLS